MSRHVIFQHTQSSLSITGQVLGQVVRVRDAKNVGVALDSAEAIYNDATYSSNKLTHDLFSIVTQMYILTIRRGVKRQRVLVLSCVELGSIYLCAILRCTSKNYSQIYACIETNGRQTTKVAHTRDTSAMVKGCNDSECLQGYLLASVALDVSSECRPSLI